jgi:hypothetical protein
MKSNLTSSHMIEPSVQYVATRAMFVSGKLNKSNLKPTESCVICSSELLVLEMRLAKTGA